ncbi:hypothetical protein STEG23_006305 [Scotinomys teguina]
MGVDLGCHWDIRMVNISNGNSSLILNWRSQMSQGKLDAGLKKAQPWLTAESQHSYLSSKPEERVPNHRKTSVMWALGGAAVSSLPLRTLSFNKWILRHELQMITKIRYMYTFYHSLKFNYVFLIVSYEAQKFNEFERNYLGRTSYCECNQSKSYQSVCKQVLGVQN